MACSINTFNPFCSNFINIYLLLSIKSISTFIWPVHFRYDCTFKHQHKYVYLLCLYNISCTKNPINSMHKAERYENVLSKQWHICWIHSNIPSELNIRLITIDPAIALIRIGLFDAFVYRFKGHLINNDRHQQNTQYCFPIESTHKPHTNDFTKKYEYREI